MIFSSAALAWKPNVPVGVKSPVSWYLNGKGGHYFVPIVQGKLLGSTIGIVRTDSNCTPDNDKTKF